ncbi:MAG: hypothetical protein HYT73_03480 [Candidatus Aenigmarchaeota archaeon]|nr:hypothetical protein [Candidatus Aenigmarchaeota archaeon]
MGDERKREIDRLLDEEFGKNLAKESSIPSRSQKALLSAEKGKGFFRRHLLLILALIPIVFFNTLTLLAILGVI